MQITPTGPTGAAIASPIKQPLSSNNIRSPLNKKYPLYVKWSSEVVTSKLILSHYLSNF
jgi:hypothetical protein